MLDLFNTFITVLGILLGFSGVALTFLTFFAPGFIQEFALKDPIRWMIVPPQIPGNKTYRHRIFSGFTIEVGFSDPVSDEDFFEPWMQALYRPNPKASSYYVTLFFNGLPMDRLLFLQYDGTRSFIPVPVMKRVENRYYFSFSRRQKQFADIVGYDDHKRPFNEVADSITKSRYNPTFLSLPDTCLSERLEALQDDIDALKSKICQSKI